MIKQSNNYYFIETKNLSYVFHVNDLGVAIFDYFGDHIDTKDINGLGLKQKHAKGTSTMLDRKADPDFCLDNELTEFSLPQKGDYKEPSIVLENASRGYVFDFRFESSSVNQDVKDLEELPSPHKLDEELIVVFKEKELDIRIELHYLISNEHDVIVRNTQIINNTDIDLFVLKNASLQLDLINEQYELVNLNGGWITEAHKESQPIHTGIYINDSKTGNSSAKHNPFFMIQAKGSQVDYGKVYAFNLIYSGNHQELVELTTYDHLRLQTGINPHLFRWTIHSGERFISPYAITSFSSKGINLVSQRMHEFVNDNIVNENFGHCLRPVIENNWEGTYFKFNERKLFGIAKSASKFGVDTFVLDDGWFSTRDDDTQALGDYDVNTNKLPHGLSGLAKRINSLGLNFGLWMEPEAISHDSKLYEEHPDWAITVKGVTPSEGRNEYLLNLTRKEVQDYLIDSISEVLSCANISYIKWDMNRNMSDIMQEEYPAGEFFHRYYLGLYRVMKTLTSKFPHVLFEGCASGGNRFDLGILTYFPQIWASDCTDPYERLSIQGGLLLGYPQSTMTAHVSHRSNHQILRNTTYPTKFNTCVFGVLGYELMLNEVTPLEQKQIKEQIAFYKEHQNLFQYGEFSFIKEKLFAGDDAMWMVMSKDRTEAVIGYFNGIQTGRPKDTILKGFNFIEDKKYTVQVFAQGHDMRLFGNLINMISPVHLNCEGKLVSYMARRNPMEMEKEHYAVDGALLNSGLILKSQWAGNGYSENARVLADFGSRLYYIKMVDEQNKQ